jgi:hypothetical protein
MEPAREKERTEMEMKEREAAVGIAREQSEAEAYSKKKVSEGETRLEESYERIEGSGSEPLQAEEQKQ